MTDGYVLRGKTPAYDFSAVLFSEGGAWFKGEAEGDWTPTIDTPEMRSALEQFKALASIGPAAPQTVAQAEATSLMQGGGVLQATLVTAVAAALENPDASRVAGKIGYAVLPGGTPVSGTWTLGIPTGLPAELARRRPTTSSPGLRARRRCRSGPSTAASRPARTSRRIAPNCWPWFSPLPTSAPECATRLPRSCSRSREPTIGEYLAGTIDLEETVTRMQADVTRVVKEAGFLQ